MINSLLAKISSLSKSNNDDQVYDIIMEQLKCESNDINLWLALAIVSAAPPFGDDETSIRCINKAFAIDDKCVLALLILAHTYEFVELRGIDDALLYKIENFQADSNELSSMLKYVASWAYCWNRKNNPIKEEQLLKKSIEFCGDHVWNYVQLADLYFKEGRKTEAYLLIDKALGNIKKVYTLENISEYDSTSIDDFINARIKGTHITSENVESIRDLLV